MIIIKNPPYSVLPVRPSVPPTYTIIYSINLPSPTRKLANTITRTAWLLRPVFYPSCIIVSPLKTSLSQEWFRTNKLQEGWTREDCSGGDLLHSTLTRSSTSLNLALNCGWYMFPLGTALLVKWQYGCCSLGKGTYHLQLYSELSIIWKYMYRYFILTKGDIDGCVLKMFCKLKCPYDILEILILFFLHNHLYKSSSSNSL